MEKLDAYMERLIKEANTLGKKILKAESALLNKKVPREAIGAVTTQLAFMNSYYKILKLRIKGEADNLHLSFGEAVLSAKNGYKVARKGWNGKGMYITIMPGYPDGIEANENTRKAHNLPEGAILKFRPYFQLFTAQGDVAMWSPSGSDALAEDWVIV